MSDSSVDQKVDSAVLPSPGQLGAFRCGVCWSSLVVVSGRIEGDQVYIRLSCPYCSNQTDEVQVELRA